MHVTINLKLTNAKQYALPIVEHPNTGGGGGGGGGGVLVVSTVNRYTAFCFVYLEMTKSAKNI